MLLLVGAGLLIRSFSRLLDVSPGFQTQHLLTMELSLPEKAYPDGAPVQKFYTQLMASVKAVPGIQAAGAVSQMPLDGFLFFRLGLLRRHFDSRFPETAGGGQSSVHGNRPTRGHTRIFSSHADSARPRTAADRCG